MQVLDVTSRSSDPVAKALSNFAQRPFFLDGVFCGSMEGFLQALKFASPDEAKLIAALVGYRAFKIGQTGNNWKIEQKLYWCGVYYPRHSPAYQTLLDRAYDAQFDQCPDLAELLRKTVGKALRHTMGKHNSCDSVLTESEYVRQLERLRWRALEESKDDHYRNQSR